MIFNLSFRVSGAAKWCSINSTQEKCTKKYSRKAIKMLFKFLTSTSDFVNKIDNENRNFLKIYIPKTSRRYSSK